MSRIRVETTIYERKQKPKRIQRYEARNEAARDSQNQTTMPLHGGGPTITLPANVLPPIRA